MRAVLMRRFGAEDVLQIEDVPTPEPSPGEALVRVGAVEVSRTRDVATRGGNHPFSKQVALPRILGGDFAGTVAAVGAGVDAGLVGRRVVASLTQTCGECEACRGGHRERCPRLSMLGIHRDGSYAELAVVNAAALAPIPDDLPLPQAAALAADGAIAFAQLGLAGAGPGTTLLVTGATGALGSTLAALGVHLGARTVGLARRPGQIPAGLDLAGRLDAADPGLTEALLALAPDGVDAAVDNVAAPQAFRSYFPALAVGARIVCSGAIGDPELPVLPVPAAPLYMKSISLLGMRTARAADFAGFWELVAGGFRLPPGLVDELPLERAAEAHARIAAGEQLGHTVLTVAR